LFVFGILFVGLSIVAGMQFVIAAAALKDSVAKSLMCVFLPLYVFVYGNRATVSPWFMRLWYCGIGLLELGGIMAS